MADLGTMTTKTEGSSFDGFPVETILPIFCSLPNVGAVLNFGAISRKHQAILLENEGVIARNLAIRILGDDDPGLVKLAFIACYARDIIRQSIQGVRQFLEAYVNRGRWPTQFYRLRALGAMPKINMGIELLEDWIATYGMLWPVTLEDKCFTATESLRLRRHLYILEAAVTILQPIEDHVPEDEFQPLAKRYWETFSRCEVDAAWDILWQFSPSRFSCITWSACIGRKRRDNREYIPRPPRAELRQALNFIGVDSNSLFLPHPHWRHISPIFTALKNSHEGERERGCAHFLEPFTDDPSAFFTEETANSELFEHKWGDLETYYNPQAIQWNVLHRYYFMIGDKDRCEQVIHESGIWDWKPDHPLAMIFNEISIWHDDPVALGRRGCVTDHV
ncbi:hypothetical protein F5Y13DRAFT_179698 [Hypoxylon sp. FL1857]|nr:hypothetical protein F5Y13DRAFT_179698 [Hypoxylon sp. FL1857]